MLEKIKDKNLFKLEKILKLKLGKCETILEAFIKERKLYYKVIELNTYATYIYASKELKIIKYSKLKRLCY